MLKVLIVDDEFIIREGLKTIINWMEYGFEVCDTAENGWEGLKKIEQHKPNLVIVDIKMPVMNGLQMVEELNKREDPCKVIILTAYSDFGYAQQFIELGIDFYILKPIEQKDLIDKLIKIRGRIESEEAARQHIDNSMLLSRDNALEEIVTGVAEASATDKYIRQYRFNFPWKSYRVGLVEICRECSLDVKLRKQARGLIEDYISRNSYGYVFDIDQYIGMLLGSISEMALPRVLMTLQNIINKNCDVKASISVGFPVPALDRAVQSYLDAFMLLEDKFLYGQRQIMISTGEKKNESVPEPERAGEWSTDQAAKAILSAMDVNNTVRINNLLEEIRDWNLKCRLSEETIKINYTGLYLTIINNLVSAEETMKNCSDDNCEVLEEIGDKSSLQELHGYIKFRLLFLSERLNITRPQGTMKRILDYIDRNYAGDIKLENLAVLFNYNSTYLGKLFKAQTGMYFNAYLDSVRLEKAKQLLNEGYKVYQVVEKVGIKDIDYFYRKFKKYTGVSPSSFKA